MSAIDKKNWLNEYMEKKSNLPILVYDLSKIGDTQLIVFIYHDVEKSFCFSTSKFQPIVTSNVDNDDDNDCGNDRDNRSSKPITDGKNLIKSCLDNIQPLTTAEDHDHRQTASPSSRFNYDHRDCIKKSSIVIETESKTPKRSATNETEEEEEKEDENGEKRFEGAILSEFLEKKNQLLNTVEELSKIGNTQCLLLIMNYDTGELTEFCTKYLKPVLLGEDGKELIKYCIKRCNQ